MMNFDLTGEDLYARLILDAVVENTTDETRRLSLLRSFKKRRLRKFWNNFVLIIRELAFT